MFSIKQFFKKKKIKWEKSKNATNARIFGPRPSYSRPKTYCALVEANRTTARLNCRQKGRGHWLFRQLLLQINFKCTVFQQFATNSVVSCYFISFWDLSVIHDSEREVKELGDGFLSKFIRWGCDNGLEWNGMEWKSCLCVSMGWRIQQ